ncbi:MAG: hypothetical protein DHS20C16_32450 [Phycisphaerae bacterium]|nr:MAG: hypothetical protein DHS20C16_32450 [Phycisphaerae bacterium]
MIALPGVAVPVCMLVTVVVMRMGVVNMFRVTVCARTHDVNAKTARESHAWQSTEDDPESSHLTKCIG